MFNSSTSSLLPVQRKLAILADAAKYDASCSSSGTAKRSSVGGKGIGSTEGSGVKSYDMKKLHELVGFPDVWDFEKRHVETK